MKKAAFFILVLFTYYWAAMYRSMQLMVLCVAELLLLVILLVLPRVFRRRLSAHFLKHTECTGRNAMTSCRIVVQNRGRLPVSRVRLRLRLRYTREKKGVKSVKKKLYGGGERGESVLAFQFCPAYCGLVQVQMDRLRAYDYLSLFSAGKRLKEEMMLAVFPGEQAMHISIASFGGSDDFAPMEQPVSRPGDSFHEIRQIREYRSGDSKRHIHWNQSAKTDQLWIKEYERDMDFQSDILIDMRGSSAKDASAWSAFYRLLSALVLGLLRDSSSVRVYWQPEVGEELSYADVADADQCRDLLLALYQTEFAQSGEPNPTTFGRCALRLTGDLSLFNGNTLLHRFTAEGLERELQETGFTI